jgi:hypothetical protein
MNGLKVYLRSDVRTRNALHNKLGCDSRLRLTDIFWSNLSLSPTPRHATHTHTPEQKLAIQIADIDCVHVYNVDILEPCQSKVSQDLATQATSADDEDFGIVAEKVFNLDRWVSYIYLKRRPAIY